jgi:hypothetical protein
MIEAVAYDKDGKRLGGNMHSINAETQRDAVEIAKSRQRANVATSKVTARVVGIYENHKRIGP